MYLFVVFFEVSVSHLYLFLKSWKYDIRRDVNSDFSIVTMRRVAIIFFKLGVIKSFVQKF